MVMERGDIWWANLPDPVGSNPGHRRPVLIIQSDAFNRSRINTVVVAVITSNLKLAKAPGNIFLSKRSSGLPKDSVVNVSQILTIDKTFLFEHVSTLSKRKMEQINKGLRLFLEL
jgi:mRNA interferase MazF